MPESVVPEFPSVRSFDEDGSKAAEIVESFLVHLSADRAQCHRHEPCNRFSNARLGDAEFIVPVKTALLALRSEAVSNGGRG